jgi:hypothetical protein
MTWQHKSSTQVQYQRNWHFYLYSLKHCRRQKLRPLFQDLKVAPSAWLRVSTCLIMQMRVPCMLETKCHHAQSRSIICGAQTSALNISRKSVFYKCTQLAARTNKLHTILRSGCQRATTNTHHHHRIHHIGNNNLHVCAFAKMAARVNKRTNGCQIVVTSAELWSIDSQHLWDVRMSAVVEWIISACVQSKIGARIYASMLWSRGPQRTEQRGVCILFRAPRRQQSFIIFLFAPRCVALNRKYV